MLSIQKILSAPFLIEILWRENLGDISAEQHFAYEIWNISHY